MGDRLLDKKRPRHERADHAAARVLTDLLDSIESNLPGALTADDPEALHDLRVAIRRTRAVQRELRSAFPPGPLSRFRQDFRSLQRATSTARDLDVYVLQFDDFRRQLHEGLRPDLEPLLAVLRERRALARQEMSETLGSERTQTLLSDWRDFLRDLQASSGTAGRRAGKPIRVVAGRRISKVYARMVRDGREVSLDSPAEPYHELRKKGKELRYLLELFGKPLYPQGVVKPMIKTLKGLQDTLGRHQDREVQVATMRSLTEPVGAMPDSAPTLIAMEVLIERLQEDAERCRLEFSGRFAAFAARPQRRMVKETFA